MKKIILFITILFSATSCDLETDFGDAIEAGVDSDVDPATLLPGVYGGLRALQGESNLLPLVLHTTDEMAGPTRGSDWDDGGVWRVMHRHTWGGEHPYILNVWKSLNNNAYNAQQVLCFGGTGSIGAQATFLRVFNEFMASGFIRYSYREVNALKIMLIRHRLCITEQKQPTF